MQKVYWVVAETSDPNHNKAQFSSREEMVKHIAGCPRRHATFKVWELCTSATCILCKRELPPCSPWCFKCSHQHTEICHLFRVVTPVSVLSL